MNARQLPERILGDRLLILGAGIGGCFAAASFSKYFRTTLVVDKDVLPQGPVSRMGVAQGSHIHGLLRRPFDVACELLPGFEEDLQRAGAIKLRMSDQARLHDAGAWQPRRDLGISVYGQSRELLEHVLRSRVSALENVAIRDRTQVEDYIIENGRIAGAVVRSTLGSETLEADLVVDSTGRTSQIVNILKRHGYSDIASTELGVQIGYTSACFTRSTAPDAVVGGYLIRSSPPNTRSGSLWPIENDRWVISLSGRFADFAPPDAEGFREFANTLGDPVISEAIRSEKRVTAFARFNVPRIYWRHFERMARFPDRLIPLGDAVAGFNPVYAQGMAVAVLQVEQVRSTLAEFAANRSGLEGISRAVLPRTAAVTEAVWSMSEPADLAYEMTTGIRPKGFAERIAFSKKVRQAIEGNADLHCAFARVFNLLDPPSVLAEMLRPTKADAAPAARSVAD